MTRRPAAWLLAVAITSLPIGAYAQTAKPEKTPDKTADMTPAQAKKLLGEIQPRAKAGDAAAEYNLGVLYDEGVGVAQNYDKARRWYQKAAEQHYGRAEHNLGIMYESGKGVAKNLSRAAYWFRRGARDDEPASQNNLGVLYMEGRGVTQDTGKAAFWTARAAAAGNGAAVDNLPRIVAKLPHVHVNGSDVNVRSAPNRGAKVVRQADSDTTIVEIGRQADWTEILFPQTYETGWVANFLLANSLAPLAPSASTTSGNEPSSKPTQTSTSSNANQQASETSAPASSTPKNETANPSPPAAPVAPTVDQNASTKPEPESPQPQPQPSSEPASPSVPSSAMSTAGNQNSKTAAAAADEPQAPERRSAPQSVPAKTQRPAGQQKKQDTRRVGVDAANLRTRPSRTARVIGQVHRDDELTVRGQKNGWIRVTAPDGTRGWVAGYLLIGG